MEDRCCQPEPLCPRGPENMPGLPWDLGENGPWSNQSSCLER